MMILNGGQDERFEQLYRKYYGRVYRFFHRTLRVADDEAHDLAQETFKRIYEAFETYRGEAEWAFIEITARNVYRNWIRGFEAKKRKAIMVYLDDPEITIDAAAPEEPDYADREESARRTQQVLEAVRELPEGQQQCLRLYIAGFKYTEIAATLHISVDAVKSRLRDAKKYLRGRLGDKS